MNITKEKVKLDERKYHDANNVDKIIVEVDYANVNFFVNDSSSVEVYCYGELVGDDKVDFDFCCENSELKITLKITEYSADCNLKLEIWVPKKTFKKIFIESEIGEINIDRYVLTQFLEVRSRLGSININAVANKSFIVTMSGEVNFKVDADKDIELEIGTISGEVSIELNNIRFVSIFKRTITGEIKNLHKDNGDYFADISVSTTSGKICIK